LVNCRELKFNIINFVEVEYSRRVNPIQQNTSTIGRSHETLNLVESLQKVKRSVAVRPVLPDFSVNFLLPAFTSSSTIKSPTQERRC
jgi:hypothetical protein